MQNVFLPVLHLTSHYQQGILDQRPWRSNEKKNIYSEKEGLFHI